MENYLKLVVRLCLKYNLMKNYKKLFCNICKNKKTKILNNNNNKHKQLNYLLLKKKKFFNQQNKKKFLVLVPNLLLENNLIKQSKLQIKKQF